MAHPHSYVSEYLMAAMRMLPRLWHINGRCVHIPSHGDIKNENECKQRINGMKLKNEIKNVSDE
eukprot:scaffold86982_cov45-Cyclotella_meneghiniana.AAC.1